MPSLIFILVLQLVLLLGPCVSYLGPPAASKRLTRAWAEDEGKGGSKKSTAFERGLNDFIGKRYGAGESFYGRRQSRLSEEEYQEARAAIEKPLFDENAEFRKNAVLVVGGEQDIAQWVVFDLVEKGFAVRVASLDRKSSIAVYGLPGVNVDLVELKATAAEYKESDYFRAISDAQAVVLCAAFSSSDGKGAEEAAMAQLLLKAIEKKRAAGGKQDVQKIVNISRFVPKAWPGAEGSALSDFVGRLFGGNGGGRAGSGTTGQALHSSLEASVRSSGLDYVVVRAPPSCDETRPGAVEDLLLLQGDEAGPKAADLSRRVAAACSDSGGLSVGLLDLAETAVQALIQDAASATFTVCADPSGRFRQSDLDERPLAKSMAMEAAYGPSPPPRVPGKERVGRGSYYAILDMADRDMKTSYMLRSPEMYRGQVDEDVKVESYWSQKLSALVRDQ